MVVIKTEPRRAVRVACLICRANDESFLKWQNFNLSKAWAVYVGSQVNIIRPRSIYKIPVIGDVCYEIT